MSWFKKNKRKSYKPMEEIIYPDSGGYIGFSLTIWDTHGASMDKDILVSNWGGVEGTEGLKNSAFAFEGRFFAFGQLLRQDLRNGNTYEELKQISNNLFHRWKPIIDEIVERERRLLGEPGRKFLHIDEVVDEQLKARI